MDYLNDLFAASFGLNHGTSKAPASSPLIDRLNSASVDLDTRHSVIVDIHYAAEQCAEMKSQMELFNHPYVGEERKATASMKIDKLEFLLSEVLDNLDSDEFRSLLKRYTILAVEVITDFSAIQGIEQLVGRYVAKFNPLATRVKDEVSKEGQ